MGQQGQFHEQYELRDPSTLGVDGLHNRSVLCFLCYLCSTAVTPVAGTIRNIYKLD